MSETNTIGRFGHHPDPAIDFCVEVEEIEAIWTDRCNKFANPDDAALDARVGRALSFRVGGDLHAINAKDRLRRIESDIVEQAIEAADRIRAAAPDLYAAARDLESIMQSAQAILARHVDPGGDLQDPQRCVNELLWVLDHQETLRTQRNTHAALAKAHPILSPQAEAAQETQP